MVKNPGIGEMAQSVCKGAFFPSHPPDSNPGTYRIENCVVHIVLWLSQAHRKRGKEKKNTESWALVQGMFHDSQSVPSVSW